MKYFIFFIIALILCIGFIPPSNAEKYYKWVDEYGVTHVTNDPKQVPKPKKQEPKKEAKKGEEPSSLKKFTLNDAQIYFLMTIKKRTVQITVGIVTIIALVLFFLGGRLRNFKKKEKSQIQKEISQYKKRHRYN